eukprot:11759011-Karenia_brevis.AAC.1
MAFPQAMRALKGWEKLCPSSTRPPLPWHALQLILLDLLARDKVAMALCVLLGFLTYMRPRELTGLTVGQLVQPLS